MRLGWIHVYVVVVDREVQLQVRVLEWRRADVHVDCVFVGELDGVGHEVVDDLCEVVLIGMG